MPTSVKLPKYDAVLLKANNLSGITNTTTARTNLGLGAVATDDVVPVVRGGTGGTTATAARTNLGLGTAAVVNTGTALAQLPTGLNIQEGLEGSSGDVVMHGKTIFVVGNGTSNQPIFVLGRRSANLTRGDMLYGSISGRVTSPSGNRDQVFDLRLGYSVGVSATTPRYFMFGNYFFVGTGQVGTSEPKLVTFTLGGQNYVGVMLDGNRSPDTTNFTGYFANSDPIVATWILANTVTALAVVNSNAISVGRPGDSIGGNQSLHISGSPNTSKEVMVDGSGFIVEV